MADSSTFTIFKGASKIRFQNINSVCPTRWRAYRPHEVWRGVWRGTCRFAAVWRGVGRRGVGLQARCSHPSVTRHQQCWCAVTSPAFARHISGPAGLPKRWCGCRSASGRLLSSRPRAAQLRDQLRGSRPRDRESLIEWRLENGGQHARSWSRVAVTKAFDLDSLDLGSAGVRVDSGRWTGRGSAVVVCGERLLKANTRFAVPWNLPK